MNYWQSVFAVCLANLVSAFAVLTGREVIAVLEFMLRDLRLDELEAENDATYYGDDRAELRRGAERVRGSA